MTDLVLKTIEKYDMLAPNERVAVALSGGADSVSLLLMLMELGYGVFAIHVNHHLRGEESDRDEMFCRCLCERLGVELKTADVDVKSFCEVSGRSIEDGARKLRYDAIEGLSDGCKIATAHNLGDCLETTLFNLARGCGIAGVAGIPPVRENIIRPLIEVSRNEILEYLFEKGQDYVTDSTNLTDDCSRNIIRHNVVSELEKINPSLLKTYRSSVENIRSANEYINSCAASVLSRARKDGYYEFEDGIDEFLLSCSVSLLLRENGFEPSKLRVDELMTIIRGGGKVNLEKGKYAVCRDGRLFFDGDEKLLPEEKVICGTDSLKWGVANIIFTEISQFDISGCNNESLKWLLDSDKLFGAVRVRSCRGSEKIKLFGRGFTSTVKKLLASYPADVRKSIPILSDDLGAVFVTGSGVSERVSCSGETKTAVRIEVKINL